MDKSACGKYLQGIKDHSGDYFSDCDGCKALHDYFVAEGCLKHFSDWDWPRWDQDICSKQDQHCYEANGNGGNGDDCELEIAGICFSDLWDALVSPVTDLVGSIIGDMLDAVEDVFNKIKTWLKNLLDSMLSVFTQVYDVIKDILGSVKDWFAGIWEEIKSIWRKVSAWIVGVYEDVRDWIVAAYENVKQWLTDIYERVKEAVIAVYEFIRDTIVAVYYWVGDRLKDIWEGIKTVYYWVGDMLKIAYDATLKPIFQWFADTWKAFMDMLENIGQWFEDIDKQVKEYVSGLNASIIAGIEDMIDALGDILMSVVNQVGDKIMNLPDEFQELVSDAMSTAIIAQLNVAEKTARKVLKTGVPNP